MRGLFFSGSIFFLLVTACDDTICPSKPAAEVQIVFKDILSREKKGIRVDSIIALGSDSSFYAGDSLSGYSLPVNHLCDSAIYVFVRDSVADTIVIRYNLQFSLVNKECGFTSAVENFHAGFTTFPKVISKNELPKGPDDPDIEIYF